MGVRALDISHDMRCVGPFTFDTIGLIFRSGPGLCVLMRW